MNKGDLVKAVAEKASVSQKQAEGCLDAVLETVQNAVATGDKVTLVGFGTFEARDRKERSGRNPATGKVLKIPATKVPVFSAGKLFKEKVSK